MTRPKISIERKKKHWGNQAVLRDNKTLENNISIHLTDIRSVSLKTNNKN